MGRMRSESDSIARLRRQAEEYLDQNPEMRQKAPSEDVHKLIQELHVYQIELEMQNEELRRTHVELEKSRGMYVDLYDFAPVGYFTFDARGLIVRANLTGASLLGVERRHLVKKHFARFVARECQDDFYRHCQQVLATKDRQILELKLKTQDGSEFYAQLESLTARDDRGDLCRIRTSVADISVRKKAEEKLRVYQDQLRSMAVDLSLTEERVLRQVAYDVHESLMQDLWCIKTHLDRLSAKGNVSDAVSRQFDQPKMIIAQAIQHCRSLIFQLSPPMLYDIGLMAALEEMARAIRQKHNLECTVMSIGTEEYRLENDSAIIIYRSVCELANNVVKHAQASRATIQLRRDAENLFVTVADDGVGFDVLQRASPTTRAGGFGLFSIRERLAYIGGRLDIESTPGQGTRITISIPHCFTTDDNPKD